MKTFLFALATMALVGCSGLHPVGPLAKKLPITQQGRPLPNTPNPSPNAVATGAPNRPAPPAMLVTPEDVDPNNPYPAAAKLATELSADSKANVNGPVTVEVSHIRGGIK